MTVRSAGSGRRVIQEKGEAHVMTLVAVFGGLLVFAVVAYLIVKSK
jgi:hypothetical protein